MLLASTDGADPEAISVAAEAAVETVTKDMELTVRVEMIESVCVKDSAAVWLFPEAAEI